MMRLPVPYISQIDEGRLAINDCGPACALMVARAYGRALNTGIDDLYRRYGWADKGLYVSTIQTLLSNLGVSCTRIQGNLQKLDGWVQAGFPAILLIDLYGGHFAVATGLTADGYLIHDPYRRGAEGAYMEIPDARMEALWGPHGQYNYTAIVPDKPLLGEEGDNMADLNKARQHLAAARASIDAATAALQGEAPAPAPPAGQTLEVYNAANGLRIRQTPNGVIVGALRNGQRVHELERRDGWVRHDAGGWSSAAYLRPI
ncbi:MAG TPA: cysteine peptidase family C39 domain-containing protein [Bellilinea sp.]|nr:cysteine peptidase family C39 domain-containing protein [Bellilinea sp.]